MKDERPEILINERSPTWSHPSETEQRKEWGERQRVINKWCDLHGFTRIFNCIPVEEPIHEIELENMKYN